MIGKTQRRTGAVLLAGILLVTPVRARASIFGEENVQLANIVALQIKELFQMAELITRVKMVIRGINEVGAGVRQAYRIYQAARNYSVADLKRDAKRGLYKAFPELEELDSEVRLLIANKRAVETGDFFTRVDKHDAKMRHVVESAAKHALRSTIWPVVFPGAKKLSDKPTPTERLVHERLQRSGMQVRAALENTALGMLAKKAATMVEDAESKNRTDLQSQALTAQASVQNANNTTAIKRLQELDMAHKEATDKEIGRFEKKARKELADNVGMLFQPGMVQ